jgi:chorismate synthase
MSLNSFGRLFRVTTWGESHGATIGCVLDGVPPRLALEAGDIQPYLDKRRPGGSRFVTQRREADQVAILSGTFEGLTTGAPIALEIQNQDARSGDYDDDRDLFRPGHADYTYQAKYGIRDHRGGGRASARETAMRVAAGAVARKILGPTVAIRGAMASLGTKQAERARWDWAAAAGNDFCCPDAEAVAEWEDYLDDVRKAGSSVGAVIEIEASGVPAGLGAPHYGKLDADLAAAMMGIHAVKGVEIGAGFAAAGLSGEENADEMRAGEDGNTEFLSNNAGGILGGISTGQDIRLRFAVKPTSSILTPRRTVNMAGDNAEISTTGRHDPCVGIRAVPVGEAMMACVLADHLLLHRAQCGG